MLFFRPNSGAMETQRTSQEVVSQLLQVMRETVKSYHPTVSRTGETLDKLIAGTACFPGGSGLWRGYANGGALPERFPEKPVMFVAHNFDSDRGFALSFKRHGEAGGSFWQRLLRVLSAAGISPDECFFTNALMGLKPGKAEGEMPSVPGYKDECQLFLRKQVEIVQPRAVIAIGVKAEKYISKLGCRYLAIKHPGDWHFREKVTQESRLLAEGKTVSDFISGQAGSPSSETSIQDEAARKSSSLSNRKPATTSMSSIKVEIQTNGADAWGFRLGTYNSYLMGAIEAGGKSKETIRSEFLYAHPDATGKSTFQVFFSDVIRPFGSASVSRSIRIETDAKGHVGLDPARVRVVKSAIAKGLLKELGRADKGPYPKKDSAAIEEVLRRFGVTLR